MFETHSFIYFSNCLFARLLSDVCISREKCGLCEGICRFDAINYVNDNYMIDELSCE